MNLQNKVALVTGASSGIGTACCQALIERGATVYGCARRFERLQKKEQEWGSRFRGIECDLRNPASIENMFAHIYGAHSHLDILINNAGLGHNASLIEGKYEDWQEMLSVNVLGLSLCTQRAIARMRQRDEGYIIHISSMSAHRVPAGSAMYSASKFAVRSLTEGLRTELRALNSNIRVSAISPGFVETEFSEKYNKSKDVAKQVYSRYKVMEAKDIAEQVLFLLQTPPHMEIHDVLSRPTQQPN